MDKYISNFDLGRFNMFLRQNESLETFYYINDLPSLEEMFSDEKYYAILFKQWPGEEIGHWVLLIKFTETRFEYFDCLGDSPPQEVINLLESQGFDVNLDCTSRKLMDRNGTICGKWCMFRLLCIPNNLQKFLKFIDSFKGKPDTIVNFIMNLPVN